MFALVTPATPQNVISLSELTKLEIVLDSRLKVFAL